MCPLGIPAAESRGDPREVDVGFRAFGLRPYASGS